MANAQELLKDIEKGWITGMKGLQFKMKGVR